MAKRKTKTRRKRSLSSGGNRSVTRRRRTRRSGLSEGVVVTWGQAFKKTLVSTGGSMGAVFVNKMIPATWGKMPKTAIAFSLGLLATKFGQPTLGASFTGGMMALTYQNGFMNENNNANFADPSTLEEMPIYLDENNQPMVLEEGGNYRYLSDGELISLAEAGIIELEDDED